MNYQKIFAWVVSTSILASCGGGGSPDVPSTPAVTGTTTTQAVTAPSIALELRDANNASTTTLALAGTTARATLLDASNVPIPNKLVTFSTSATLATLAPASGQTLTDAAGVALVQLNPASLTAAGAGTLTATAAVGTSTVTKTLDFQLTPASLKIETLNTGNATLAAYGNRSISVQVTANGSAVAIPVPVAFVASCGAADLSPATVNTNANGTASTTYSAIAPECFGTNVTITASVPGAASVSGQIPVAAAQVTNIQFVSSAPSIIYLTGSTGATQSIVTFKVIDSNGTAVQNQGVALSLMNSAPGISLGVPGNTQTIAATTNAAGQVSTAVYAGTIPTSVQVRAVLPANPSIPATLSNVLVVASGRAVQKAASIALGQYAIEGADFIGTTTTVTMSLADRQGNPVPNGTQINFTSESGVLVPPTCVTAGGTSECTVNIRSSGTVPADGRVSILAYLPGEEDFIDANANNIYDAGENFTDLGDAYRDDNEDETYAAVDDFTVPRASPGINCQFAISSPPSIEPDNVAGGDHGRKNRCDGVWGTSEVRRQIVVVFAGSNAAITGVEAAGSAIGQVSINDAFLKINDLRGNSMPAGSAISVTSAAATCVITPESAAVPNVYFAKGNLDTGKVKFNTVGCANQDRFTVTVTTPNKQITSKQFVFIP